MDTDISITTREFIRWIQEENLDFNAIEESQFDDLIGMETGASSSSVTLAVLWKQLCVQRTS